MTRQIAVATRRNRWVALAIFILLALPCCCIAKQEGQNSVRGSSSKKSTGTLSTIRLSASADLEDSGLGTVMLFYSKTDLGELQAGREYLVALTLTNKADVPVPIKLLKTSSKCVTARFPETTLAPGESTTGELSFRVPEHSLTGEFHGRIEFHLAQNSPPMGGLNFSAAVLGNLFTPGRSHLLELKEDIGQWEIPIYFTKPITLETLKTRKSPGFENVVVQLHETQDGHFLQLTMHKKMLNPGGVLGTIELYHESTGRSRDVSVTISRPKPFRLSPATLHFSSMKDNPDKYKAIAMLQLSGLTTSKKEGNGTNDDKKDSDPEIANPITDVKLKIGNETVPVKIVRLGTSSVYKLTVKCSRSFLKKKIDESIRRESEDGYEPNQIVWTFTTPQSTFEVEGDFFVNFKGD